MVHDSVANEVGCSSALQTAKAPSFETMSYDLSFEEALNYYCEFQDGFSEQYFKSKATS